MVIDGAGVWYGHPMTNNKFSGIIIGLSLMISSKPEYRHGTT
jgi:hypothetical protein